MLNKVRHYPRAF